MKRIRKAGHAAATAELRGASRIAVDAVEAITNIVEDMHRTISGFAPVVGTAPTGRTQGITGFVYSSVRGVTRVVGVGLDIALNQLAPYLKTKKEIPQRDAMLAALNGIFGDYLVETNNPLAISNWVLVQMVLFPDRLHHRAVQE